MPRLADARAAEEICAYLNRVSAPYGTRWRLQDRVIVPAFDTYIFGGAFYDDAYAFVDGRWMITKTGYKRTYEAMINLKDVPSFQLNDNHLAPADGQ